MNVGTSVLFLLISGLPWLQKNNTTILLMLRSELLFGCKSQRAMIIAFNIFKLNYPIYSVPSKLLTYYSDLLSWCEVRLVFCCCYY